MKPTLPNTHMIPPDSERDEREEEEESKQELEVTFSLFFRSQLTWGIFRFLCRPSKFVCDAVSNHRIPT